MTKCNHVRVATSVRGVLASILAVIAIAVCGELPGSSHVAGAAVGRGIVDFRLDTPRLNPAIIPDLVANMGPGPAGLNAKWTRVMVFWDDLQPTEPGTFSTGDADQDGYNDAYLASLDAVVSALHANGIRTILTPCDVPEWASDRRYWSEDGYDRDIVMRIDDPVVSGAFGHLAEALASRFAGRVDHFEVWNEPNLNSCIDPQLLDNGRKIVGPAVYFKMLKAFRSGAKRGNPSAVVIAGATSRRGANDSHSTSPQWFARYLSSRKAQFDAYSHHPYTPPGSSPIPSRPPQRPASQVTLGNLKVLLDVFPGKPFYLTEFGYSTKTKAQGELFCVTVSEADQARYMRSAYALMSRHRQVKALIWFLVTDFRPDPRADRGIYSGLASPDGAIRKPGWYAFAGGNRMKLTAPSSVRRGRPFSVSGSLKVREAGREVGQKVRLQARASSSGPWKTLKTLTTRADGAFSYAYVKQSVTRRYRVYWPGICASPTVTVRAR